MRVSAQAVGRLLGGLLALVAGFVFWHTGGRASGVCAREVFVGGGDLSLWPPGTRCTYGEPALHSTYISPWFVGTSIVLLPAAILAGEWLAGRLGRARVRTR
jgi:hypothetical protein